MIDIAKSQQHSPVSVPNLIRCIILWPLMQWTGERYYYKTGCLEAIKCRFWPFRSVYFDNFVFSIPQVHSVLMFWWKFVYRSLDDFHILTVFISIHTIYIWCYTYSFLLLPNTPTFKMMKTLHRLLCNFVLWLSWCGPQTSTEIYHLLLFLSILHRDDRSRSYVAYVI